MPQVDRTQFQEVFLRRLLKLIELVQSSGLHMRMTEGYRSPKRQAELYAQGRTRPGVKVTWAKPGKSAHEWGLAADWCFTEGDPYKGHDAEWKQFGKLAKAAGLEWGGLWSTYPVFKRDLPHTQMPEWKLYR